jgi:hypothetical protein
MDSGIALARKRIQFEGLAPNQADQVALTLRQQLQCHLLGERQAVHNRGQFAQVPVQRVGKQRQCRGAAAHGRGEWTRIGVYERTPRVQTKFQYGGRCWLARGTQHAQRLGWKLPKADEPRPSGKVTSIDQLQPLRTAMRRVVREQSHQDELVIAVELRPDQTTTRS